VIIILDVRSDKDISGGFLEIIKLIEVPAVFFVTWIETKQYALEQNLEEEKVYQK